MSQHWVAKLALIGLRKPDDNAEWSVNTAVIFVKMIYKTLAARSIQGPTLNSASAYVVCQVVTDA